MDDKFLKKYKSKIQEILIQRWDPIGIGDDDAAQDEYDSYIEPLCQLLLSQQSKQEIFEFLWFIETTHMGLKGNYHHTQAIVELLWQLSGKE